MKNSSAPCTNRRDFITQIVPGCAVTCFGLQHLLASAVYGEVSPSQEDKHKFQSKMERDITQEQWIQQRHRKYIGILKRLEEDLGKQEFLESLKKASYAENVALGERLSDRIDSMNTFAGPFRDTNSGVGRTIVREIVEDSEHAFEMKITECLTETVFKEMDALDLGYACVCHADFGLPVGINPKLKLIRTKTLMQGDDCCNHRYVWEE